MNTVRRENVIFSKCSVSFFCPKIFVQKWIVDYADERFTIFVEGDRDCEERQSAREIFSSVDGIDDPEVGGG